ncbi:MAG: UPF0280 family protein [Methanoregulaceae archaeon]|nr:UPF0280 family protein [Methanoregulaceae archaeon]
MIRSRFHLRETIATILADEERHIAAAREGITRARQELEHYISGDPFFRSTFEPYRVDTGIEIVDRMSDASAVSGVGPMAAVAGSIAWAGLEAMEEAGATFGIIDNGGDIALLTDRKITIGIHAGTSVLSDRYAFVAGPRDGIFGICTSSATVGPSISFGVADSVTVISRNPALADAWATAVCNRVRTGDTSAVDEALLGGCDGICVIIGDWHYRKGSLPRVVKARVRHDLITGGLF